MFTSRHLGSLLLLAMWLSQGCCQQLQQGKLVDEVCPVTYAGECYTVLETEKAFTRGEADRICYDVFIAEEGVTTAQLADVYSGDHFQKLADYIATEFEGTTPHVLTGMHYDPMLGMMFWHDGEEVTNQAVLGTMLPSRRGSYVVISMGDSPGSDTLTNVGDTTYRRFVCQFGSK